MGLWRHNALIRSWCTLVLATGIAALSAVFLSLLSPDAALSAREPAQVIAEAEQLLPPMWSEALSAVPWEVGNLQFDGAAMEGLCEGGPGNGPIIRFSTGIYSTKSDQYWLQATAHELGHIAMCYLVVVNPGALVEWINQVGPVVGAPNHFEMFAQCWARLLTGVAPSGYAFRCPDGTAWEQTQLIAHIDPRPQPMVAAAPLLPDSPVAPDVAALTAHVDRPAVRVGSSASP
jgi:hypothetical protein